MTETETGRLKNYKDLEFIYGDQTRENVFGTLGKSPMASSGLRKVKYCTVSERPTANGAVVKGQTLKLKRRSPEHQVYEKLRAGLDFSVV